MIRLKYSLSMLWLSCFLASSCSAQKTKDLPEKIHFNLYTDSIKTQLNYYLNVEGVFKNGSIFPLDTSLIAFSADHGHTSGNEWIAPEHIDFESVHFQVWLRCDSKIRDSIQVWMKVGIDPRDMDLPVEPEIIRKKKR